MLWRAWSMVLLAVCAWGGEPERVRLQLNWFHQFQFAGIYAAELRGYFADEGLAVEIVERTPGLHPLQELSEGRAQFAIHDSGLILEWAKGRDVALVAVIMQRYPRVMLVHADSRYRTLADLISDPQARLLGPQPIGLELRLGLAALGRDPEEIFPRRRSVGDLERFAAREFDVLPAYVTNEPYRLRRLGVETRPLTVFEGNSELFFGDALVCRGDLWRSRPDLVHRLRRAVLRGWNWALDHPEQMVAAIRRQWPSAHQDQPEEILREEARVVAELINRTMVPLGTINRARLEAIAGSLRTAGQPALVRPDLIWIEPDPDDTWQRVLLFALAITGGASAGMVIAFWLLRRRFSALHAMHQHVLELAEGFCVFRATIEQGSRIVLESASPSIASVLGHPLSVYRKDPDQLLRQIYDDDRKAFIIAVQTAATTGEAWRHRFRLLHPEHERPRHLLIHALPRSEAGGGPAFDGLIIDLTAEAEANEALLETQRRLEAAQRHESLGLLASGIAHDFNNLLGAMRGNAELALLRLPPEHAARSALERVLKAADTAATLVRQILAYAGKGTIEVRSLDLVEECRVLADLLRHTVGSHIAIRVEPHGQPPPVLFDPAQLQQVLINLIVNAAEAYEGRPGTVTVRIARDEEQPERVRLEVIDQGCGMDAETQRRIFEPFFTTKQHGHGLGLAAVHGICRASNAKIAVRSAPGVGTTFTVWLPVADRPPSTRTSSDIVPVRGQRRLLVADDDALMRETVQRMAEQLGYEVETAADGTQAEALLSDPARRYDIIVLDCVMPGRSGNELLRRLREQGDRRPVVLMTGFTEGASSATYDRYTRLLMKPFSKAMFARTLAIVQRDEPERDESDATFAALQRQTGEHRRQRPPS
ncbi:MAG: ABC transporter substrate-binding protein [Planctomycetota bacterium]|nr:ABC transporter substrate-binding protein [Planctomycetota bacterium]